MNNRNGLKCFSSIWQVLAVLLVLTFSIQNGAAQDIKDTIARGIAAKDYINTLTNEDVPLEWRTTVKESQTDSYFMKRFFRGDERKLEVLWRKDWNGQKEKMFTATVYDRDKRIAKIMHIGESTAVAQLKNAAEFRLITAIKDDGTVSLMISSENGYFDVIKVQGRDTCLVEDLEYTKTAMLKEEAIDPLLDAVKRKLNANRRRDLKSPKMR